MPSLLIVDDQKGVRDAIASIIRGTDFGIDTILHAGDCGSAIDMIDTHRPTIIFLDIMMNGKDGFSVARHISEKQIPCHVVIMTAFPEFDFAMKALRYKVTEFLLKPITEEKVYNTLCMIFQTEEKNRKEMLNLNRREMLYYLLLDNYLKNQEVHIQPGVIYEHTGLDLVDHANIFIVLLSVTGEEEAGSITSVSDEMATNGYEVVCYPQTGDQFVFLVGCRDMTLESGVECLLGILLGRLGHFFAGSSLQHGDHSLKAKYQQSAVALEYAKEKGLSDDIIALEAEESVCWVFSKHEDRIVLGIEDGDKPAVQSAVADVFVDCMRRNLPPAKVAGLFEDFFMRYGIRYPQQLPRKDYFSVKSKVVETLDGFNFSAGESSIPPCRVREVIAYLQEHYADDISLSDVADALSVNYYYLSYLFKKNMHVGFAVFLNNMRLENAARLITATHYTVDNIARIVGYKNLRYFYKLFKEQFGQTPKQYREKHMANRHVV